MKSASYSVSFSGPCERNCESLFITRFLVPSDVELYRGIMISPVVSQAEANSRAPLSCVPTHYSDTSMG